MNQNRTHTHLLPEDRYAIEQGLYEGKTFKAIARMIHKDPTTISKEVRRNTRPVKTVYKCAEYPYCHRKRLCTENDYCFDSCKRCGNGQECVKICKDYKAFHCEYLDRPPYVCNGCKRNSSTGCLLVMRKYYRASHAQKAYEKRLSTSRTGINLTLSELRALDELVVPLLKKGQPVSHIYAHHEDELGISRKTLYNYIDQGALTVRNIDLRRRVKYKKRKKQSSGVAPNYKYRSGRTYKDFQNYLADHPETDVVEMDTVKGSNTAGQCLLTMMFRSSSLMLIFLLKRCTQEEVKRVFDDLSAALGIQLFRKTFPVILTDNGAEFKDPSGLEKTANGARRTRLFYCDPSNSNQKARLEKNHEYIRYVIPKGRSLYRMTDEKTLLLCSHINSVARDSLNGHKPYQLAELLQSKEVLAKLGLCAVPPDDINLTPELLK